MSPDGKYVAVGGGTTQDMAKPHPIKNFIEDGMVQVWEVRTGALKLTIRQRGEQTMRVSFLPDGTSLAIGDHKTTKVVDAASGALRFEVEP